MKRILACALALSCILLAISAIAEAVDGFLGTMEVVNCEEWVSLRLQPNKASRRLREVPLGETVEKCYRYSEQFIRCEYKGTTGFILAEYLKVVDTVEADENDIAEDVDTAFTEDETEAEADEDGRGEIVLESVVDGLRVTVEREFVGDGERLLVTCETEDGEAVWHREAETSYMTELSLTDAFIGGTSEQPRVMIYDAEHGLVSVDLRTGDALWTLAPDEVRLGGSLSHAVAEDGTMYIGGYYGPDPVAIDVNGRVLWQSDTGDEDIYWLFQIELASEGVVAHYENFLADEEAQSGRVVYGWDGGVLRAESD